MTKRLSTLAAFCCATIFASTPIDGHWTTSMQSTRQSQPVEMNLTAQDNHLTGDVISIGGKKNKQQTMHIENGTINDGHFSFTTVHTSKKQGPMKFLWEGTVNGDQLQGTRTREGGKHAVPFTAKR